MITLQKVQQLVYLISKKQLLSNGDYDYKLYSNQKFFNSICNIA